MPVRKEYTSALSIWCWYLCIWSKRKCLMNLNEMLRFSFMQYSLEDNNYYHEYDVLCYYTIFYNRITTIVIVFYQHYKRCAYFSFPPYSPANARRVVHIDDYLLIKFVFVIYLSPRFPSFFNSLCQLFKKGEFTCFGICFSIWNLIKLLLH